MDTVYKQESVNFKDNDLSGSVSGACLDPPSAQSLFARTRRYLVRRGVRLSFKTSPLLSQRQSKLYKETVIGSAYPPVINRHTLCAAASPAQWRESMRRVRERYPPFFAHTGSCARPKSSCGLRFSLMPQVFAGCCQSLLEDGPSRRYLCESFPTCLDPYPGCPYGAFTRFFP